MGTAKEAFGRSPNQLPENIYASGSLTTHTRRHRRSAETVLCYEKLISLSSEKLKKQFTRPSVSPTSSVSIANDGAHGWC